jgi:hypothetical protein
MKEVRDLVRRRDFSIDEILGFAPDGNLSSDCNLGAVVVSDGTVGCIAVVEDYGYAGFADACLSLFVNEFGEIAGSDLAQVCDSQDKADGVENV